MNYVDEYRDNLYFENLINKLTDKIAKYKRILQDCDEETEKRIRVLLNNRYKDLISAEFSQNSNMQEIQRCFRDYAECLCYVGYSSYSECVDFLSLIIILDITDIDVPTLAEYGDDLTQFLFCHIIHNSKGNISRGLLFPKYYKPFLYYAYGKMDGPSLINYVNERWYNTSFSMSWYDSHLCDNDTYTGYWCYVASALLRIMGDFCRVDGKTKYIV